MITATHSIIFSDDAPATRAFLRDVLQMPWVADAGSPQHPSTNEPSERDWLIFASGPSEMGVHPTANEGGSPSQTGPRGQLIAFMCDDVYATAAQLAERGATFAGEVTDQGWGLVVMVQVPGADDIMIYQPRHATAYDKVGSA